MPPSCQAARWLRHGPTPRAFMPTQLSAPRARTRSGPAICPAANAAVIRASSGVGLAGSCQLRTRHGGHHERAADEHGRGDHRPQRLCGQRQRSAERHGAVLHRPDAPKRSTSACSTRARPVRQVECAAGVEARRGRHDDVKATPPVSVSWSLNCSRGIERIRSSASSRAAGDMALFDPHPDTALPHDDATRSQPSRRFTSYRAAEKATASEST